MKRDCSYKAVLDDYLGDSFGKELLNINDNLEPKRNRLYVYEARGCVVGIEKVLESNVPISERKVQ